MRHCPLPRRLRPASLAAGLALAAGSACAPDLPTAPRAADPAAALARGGDGGTVRVNGRYQVAILDDCGGPTWDALGGCAIQSAVTLPAFLDAVFSTGLHPAWRNDPAQLAVKQNAKLRVVNAGGREHTFTRVARFGGGHVPILNQLPDTRVVAPECAVPRPEEIVHPGEAIEVRVDHRGPKHDHDERYQCCIHPWMRTTVQVRHDAPR